MADRSSTGSTEVKHLCARLDENVTHSTKDTSSQLRSEGVPDTVLGLCGLWFGSFDRYPLLAVDRFARNEVFGNQHVVFAFGNEDSGVGMGLEDGPGSSPGAASSSPTTTSTVATTTAGTTTATTSRSWR